MFFILRISVAFFILFLFLYLLWVRKHALEDNSLLNSKEYHDAVVDWEGVLKWYKDDYKGNIDHFYVFVESNSFCGRRLFLFRDKEGNLSCYGVDNLNTKEFIILVNKVKSFLDYPGRNDMNLS